MNLLSKIKKGVIHVGGNFGQASKSYGNLNVLWVEPTPKR